MAGNNNNFNPTLDAGLGLIFRLNALWNKADRQALNGDMEGWNFTLDRIFSNLSYRGEMNVTYEDPREKDEAKKKIVDIQLSPKEANIHTKFKVMLKAVKSKRALALRRKDHTTWNMTREEEYELLMKKDIWLRKLMQIQKLYIKESEFDASKAMWGG